MDNFQPPWSNPPGTPTLDFLHGGSTDLPPEVLSAIGRFRMQAANDQDRQTLITYLAQNYNTIPADEAVALGNIIGSMGGGNPSSGLPQPVSPSPPASTQGAFWNAQAASQGVDQPDIPDTTSQTQAATSAQLPTPPMASMSAPPPGPADASRGQFPAQVMASQQMPQDLRTADPNRRGGRSGQGANWKMIEGLGGGSAFSDISPQYLSAYVADPNLAAQEIAGPEKNLTAQGMAPLVGSALEMAKLGLLGGGKGHGLGGPSSSGQQLGRAEALVNSLGPGQYIDPGAVMRRTMHRAGRTPVGDLQTGQGNPNDIMQQVAVTQNAILGPLKGTATTDAYNGTATMLDQEANSWLQAVAHGEIDPNQVSYPAWLREHHRQRFLGR